ncbi:MAG: hypothetical protein HYY93_04275 [Planctomycetes bacterium]|nr:hypothetical protein [Planctomycetota bacterium]
MSRNVGFGGALLALWALALMTATDSRSRSSWAEGTQTVDGGRKWIVASVGVGAGNDALCVIDTERERIALYQINQGKELCLKAVRQVSWDLQCYDWPGKSQPSVEDIRKGVEEAGKGKKNVPPPPAPEGPQPK